MKFSKTTRDQGDTLISENFNPGPGFYLGNDQRYSDLLKFAHPYYGGQDAVTRFAKEARFRKTKVEQRPGPGTYSTQQSFLTRADVEAKKTLLENMARLTNRSAQSQGNLLGQNFRVNAVPSIPSSRFSPGYQEVGDGLVVSMNHESYAYRHFSPVGPGSYNPILELVKPRRQFTVIRSKSTANSLGNKVLLNHVQNIRKQQDHKSDTVTKWKYYSIREQQLLQQIKR